MSRKTPKGDSGNAKRSRRPVASSRFANTPNASSSDDPELRPLKSRILNWVIGTAISIDGVTIILAILTTMLFVSMVLESCSSLS
jgi:hypothetical protein